MTAEDLAWAIEDVRARLAAYALARAYDTGNHRLLFATQKFRSAFGDLFQEFADNLCDDVVDALTDRLQIAGWSSTAAASAADPATTDTAATPQDQGPDELTVAVNAFWEDTNGDARLGAIHRNGVCEGDGFGIVQLDRAGRAHIWKQRPEQMAVRYSTDQPDEIEVAAKVWRSGKRYRANLYYPDGVVERYGTKGLAGGGGDNMPQARSFQLLPAGDPDLTALGDDVGAVDETEDGMPVFHWPNGESGQYGRGIVAKLIPLQDALNKSVADMLVAMEYHAYPQRWARGIEVELDPATGQERSPFAAGEGRVWRTRSKDAEFGQFQTASADGFLKVQDSFRLEIGRKGALPPHALNLQSQSGDQATGISLIVAEGRVTKWARDRMRDWGSITRRAVAHGLVLEGHKGVTAKDLNLSWVPPETRDMKALLEELTLKKDLGVPDSQLLLEAGYTPEEVQGFLAEMEQAGETADLARQVLTGGRRRVTSGEAVGLIQGNQPASTGDTEAA